jgi:mannose-6-phosphate isomerase-like protein (cupin superfamily)
MQSAHSFRQVVVNKPWGYEYLMYENHQVALWLLHIRQGQETSMHCHPIKTTGLVVLQGEAELSFLTGKKNVRAPEKQMIRRGLFHSTRAISEGGVFMFEIETPNDKNDLVRLSDKYGRVSAGYESSQYAHKRTSECVWINEQTDTSMDEAYSVEGIPFNVSSSSSLEFLDEKKNEDIVIFLKGGLGKYVDGRKHLAVIPGDVGRVCTLKQVAREMEFLEENTMILTVPA